MARKTIAVCVTGFDLECESQIVAGIKSRCSELDINILVFASFLRKPDIGSGIVISESLLKGECEIFNLINFDLIDGLIVLGDTLVKPEVISDLCIKAKEKNVPVVNVNDPVHLIDYNVHVSDNTAMTIMMRHLVEHHGYTKINFIGGFPGNLQTEERLAAYKQVLEENGIGYDENRVDYGHFWIDAYAVTEKFISQPELPEVIACASDTMAFFCMDCLKDHGLSVPDDIIVTGFDGSKDCNESEPTLTSVKRDFFTAGEKCVDMIFDISEGKQVDSDIHVEAKLCLNESCGCVKSKAKPNVGFIEQQYGEINDYKAFNIILSYLNTVFSSADDSDKIFSELDRGSEFFNLKRTYLCLCPDIVKGAISFDDVFNNTFNGISEYMISQYNFFNDVKQGTVFPSTQLLPIDVFKEDKAASFAFSPLYFKERFLGYIAYEFDNVDSKGDLFGRWVSAISSDIGSYYMNKELEAAISELENLYIRDHLTGLYNRRGMDKLGSRLVEQAKKADNYISIICADIDNLKVINDNFGHEAGDNAIVQVANAIFDSVPENAVAARTGGDEYCVIISHENSHDIAKIVSDISVYLENYNEKSQLAYKIDCSCGYYSVDVSELISIERMTRIADENMYKVKFSKKSKDN